MKKVLCSLCAALAAAVLLVGCGGPGDVAVSFCEKMAAGDLDGAAKLATKDGAKAFEMVKAMGGASSVNEELKGATFKAVDTKVDGDKATVKIEFSKDGKSETQEVKLVKEDGDWKVAVEK